MRRVAAAYGRARVSVVFGVAGVVTATTGVVTGLESTVALGIALLLASVAVYRAPEFVFEAPDPAVERGKIVEDGMTDRDVMRRFAIHTERESYRSEKAEEARKREERKAKATGHRF